MLPVSENQNISTYPNSLVFESLPSDMHNLFFYFLPNPETVCALGGVNRSFYVLHLDSGIWAQFMRCIGAPANLTPSKHNFFYFKHTQTTEENLFATKKNRFDPGETSIPQLKTQTIYRSDYMYDSDFTESARSQKEVKQLHGIGSRIYFRDFKNIFVLDAEKKTLIHAIPIPDDTRAIHIQNGMCCIIQMDATIEVLCLDSNETIAKTQGPYEAVHEEGRHSGFGIFDIQLTDQNLSIGYYRSKLIVWDYRTQSKLEYIEPPYSILPSALHHQNENALYTVYNKTLQKWDLNTRTVKQTVQTTEHISSLNIFQNCLLASNSNHLAVYDTSNLESSSQTKQWPFQFGNGKNARVINPMQFGNSILCNIDVVGNGLNIGMLKTENNIPKMEIETIGIETIGDETSIDGINMSEFTTMGKSKVLIGTLEGNIHILDFSFPFQAMRSILHGRDLVSGLRDLYHLRLSPQNKEFLDALSLEKTGVKFEGLIALVQEEEARNKQIMEHLDEFINRLTQAEIDEFITQMSSEMEKNLQKFIYDFLEESVLSNNF